MHRLEVIHANDSKAEFDSKKDRHEDLGKGKIGLAGLKRFADRKEFKKLPWILEVPSLKKDGGKKNIRVLKSLL
jgi:deoxyribonuclease-4